jgi:hypothetical protein|eukprot:COSAG06_NODE_1889_length_8134_cov_3.277785_10_plen_99_part_00
MALLPPPALAAARLTSSVGRHSYGTGMEHGWHQDSGSTDPEQFTLNRIVYPSTMLEGQGALHFVPGSINRHGGLVSRAAWSACATGAACCLATACLAA